MNETKIAGSDLFQRVIKDADDLMRSVWEGTPWMVDAHTGPHGSPRRIEMGEWCEREFGPEASPLHGVPGNWRAGGVTIHGFNWRGFATEEMMKRFEERWPRP